MHVALRLTLVLLATAALSASASPLLIQTTDGPIQGYISTGGIYSDQTNMTARAWLGVPYAQPPLGSLRWEYPQKLKPWTTPLNTTTVTPACPQVCDLPPHLCPPTMDEDCLHMFIWAPRDVPEGTKLPVMAWIHGGHFDQGAGSDPVYNGVYYANKTNTILVTMNYRLGALGWVFAEGMTGNYGLMDQITVLQWIQSNIAAFGGDPDNVTIFGQSAGGTSVSSLIISPATKGLFSKVISESNPFGLPIASAKWGASYANRLSKDAGCASTFDLDCMRNKTVDEILNAQVADGKHIDITNIFQTFYPLTPAVGDLVPMQPLDALRKGLAHKVPLMMGSVANEGLIFIWRAFKKPLSKLAYEGVVTYAFGLHLKKVLTMYPGMSEDNYDNRYRLSELITDYLFACPVRAAAESYSTDVSPEIYTYYFNHTFSWSGGWGPNYTECEGRVCHAEELVFVFNAFYNKYIQFNSEERALGEAMAGAWTSFAKTGKPSLPNVEWPAFVKGKAQYMAFATPQPFVLPQLRQEACEMWEEIGWNYLN